MQQFKVDHCLRNGGTFPNFRKVLREERLRFQASIAARLGLPSFTAYSAICSAILERHDRGSPKYLDGKFDLSDFLSEDEGSPQTICIDWSLSGPEMTDVDEFLTADLVRQFDDVVYEGSDEVLIFDRECRLLLIFDGNGFAGRVI